MAVQHMMMVALCYLAEVASPINLLLLSQQLWLSNFKILILVSYDLCIVW